MESRIEDILQGIIDGTPSQEFDSPQSRNERLLLQILEKINNIEPPVGDWTITVSGHTLVIAPGEGEE